MTLTIAEARALISDGQLQGEQGFDVLATIGREGARDRDTGRDLLIRTLGQRDRVDPGLHHLLQGLVREHGLYPYLRDVLTMPLADQIAYESHRPEGVLERDVVFHAEQSLVYERLLAGDNVVLSAPTSFGKSLVIDAVLGTMEYCNAVVVVPTIALIDECRRRLSRLSDRYKIITHGSQELGERNLFIMTQERVLEATNLPRVDFFVIDEFYKLDPLHSAADHRTSQLNIVFDRLLRTGAQFYLLGPNITELSRATSSSLRATFVTTGYTTVSTDLETVSVKKAELPDALAAQCQAAGPATLVFCRSPQRTREVARWLMDRDVGGGTDLDEAADWVAETYHPDWIVGKALRAGIGIHHGRLPRALAHHLVRLFNEGRLPLMLATTTLIEGVNTRARTVLVLDHRINNKTYDYFTFSNIRGRAGRMSQHYVGRVVVFNPAPQAAGLSVDVPVLSQGPTVTDEILIQLPDDELTAASAERLTPYHEQTLVSMETLRSNHGQPPADQLEVARTVAEDPARWSAALQWAGAQPRTGQLNDLGPLLFALTGSGSGARTARQLTARLNTLRFHRGDVKAVIQQQVSSGYYNDVDEAIDDQLEFNRNWAQFRIPTALITAASVASDVLAKNGMTITNPSVFVGELENMFQPPYATVLEEYGLPAPTAVKLASPLALAQARSLDDVLARLKALDVTSLASGELSLFEVEMVQDSQRELPRL